MAKGFTWSYSKAKNYDTCPKRHYEVDLAKNYTDSSEQLDWGNAVHKAIASAILAHAGLPAVGRGNDRVDPKPLPATMQDYQKWVNAAVGGRRPIEQLLVERKYAITKDFQPTGWFDGNVWFRGVCDLLALQGKVASALDWKTGKMTHDSRQLMLMSQCIFAHHPEIETVKSRFIWLKEDCTSPEVFHRDTIMREWPPVLALVKEMENAAATLNYPPKPGKLCNRHCPVSSCPFHGKRHS